MKSTGVVRKIDHLGRVVVPKEIRRIFDFNTGTPIEIYVENELIFLKKYNSQRACLVTGEVSDDNKEYAPGLTLSPKGAETLLNKLEGENI